MANIPVTIINQYTLKIEQDAKKGDLINLNEINSIDTSIIMQKINEQKDIIYQEKLKQEQKHFEAQKDLAIKNAVQAYEQENLLLKERLNQIEDSLKKQYQSTLENQKQAFNLETVQIKNQYEQQNYLKTIEHQKRLTELQNELQVLTTEKKQYQLELEVSYMNQMNALKENYDEKIKSYESQIEKLTYERASLNVKRQGENLEKWCDNEYHNQNLVDQPHLLWEKANEIIKGSKPDFIFKVYATEKHNEDELLSSAVLEMKAEDPTSKTKQTNKQFYDKLNKDRINRNLEYAILVSELEWDTTNDLPVRKVLEYDKMYVVRPQYFMMFLNIIAAFGLKYKDILLAKQEERIKFKDIETILNDFEAMKEEILENSIKHISNHLDNIVKQSVIIEKANNDLKKSVDIIINTHLETIKNKINQFKIEKITKKIESI